MLYQSPRSKEHNTIRYDVDLSHLALPEDEPLSEKIIEAHRKLAYSVIRQAIDDLTSDNEELRMSAVEFCLSNKPEDREARRLWLAWIQVDEAVIAQAARKILKGAL